MTISDYVAKQQTFLKKFEVPAAFQVFESLKIARAFREVNDLRRAFLVDPLANSPYRAFINQQSQLKKYWQVFDTIDAFSSLKGLSYNMAMIEGVRLSQRIFDLKFETDDTSTEETSDIVVDESRRVKQIILDVYKSPDTLMTISPREFEEMIAELLAKQGFKVELTKQTRDKGFDILALKYLNNHSPIKFLVECKRFAKGKVGVEIIRSFKEVIETERANRGIIATTSYFTKEAVKKQKEVSYLLDYRDKESVMEWVYDYQENRSRKYE